MFREYQDTRIQRNLRHVKKKFADCAYYYSHWGYRLPIQQMVPVWIYASSPRENYIIIHLSILGRRRFLERNFEQNRRSGEQDILGKHVGFLLLYGVYSPCTSYLFFFKKICTETNCMDCGIRKRDAFYLKWKTEICERIKAGQ